MGNEFKSKNISAFAVFVQPGPNETKDRVATGGSATTVIDSSLSNDPSQDDKYSKYVVVFADDTTTAALQGLDFVVTAHDGATGALTLDPAPPVAPIAGDTFEMYLSIAAYNVQPGATVETIEREVETVTLDPLPSQRGLRQSDISFNAEIAGLVQPRSSAQGAADARDRFSQFLFGVMGYRRVTQGNTVSGGASTDTIIDVADASIHAVEDVVVINGQSRCIVSVDTASTPQKITLDRALREAPADTTEIYGGEEFRSVETGHALFQALYLMDDQLLTVANLQFDMTFGGEYGQPVEFSFSGQGNAWKIEDDKTLIQLLDEAKNVILRAGAAKFGDDDLCFTSFELALGHQISLIKDVCFYGAKVTNRDSSLNIKFRNKDNVPKEIWEDQGTVAKTLVQAGNEPGNMFSLVMNGEFQQATNSDANDVHYYDGVIRHVDPGTDRQNAKKLSFWRH